MNLRPYQSDRVAAIRAEYARGARSVLFQGPVGMGKTIIFAYICQQAALRGKTCVILVHRRELVKQASASLAEYGVPHGVIAPGWRAVPAPVQVASVQTLVRRHFDRAPDLVVEDEAHHATAGSWKTIHQRWPTARFLGVTATPARLDGKGLGEVFQVLVPGPSVRELTDAGYLAPVDIWAPVGIDTTGLHIKRGDYDSGELAELVTQVGHSITGDAIEHYRKHGGGQRFIAFTASVQHAHDTAAQFRDAGISCQALEGRMTPTDRDQALSDFDAGRILGVASCDLISEGLNVPAATVCISLRPTASLNIALQQWGRVMRGMPGKRAILLDHAGNVLRHGLPDDDREWTLEGGAGKKAKKPSLSLRTCPQCFAVARAQARVCPQCGHTYPIKANVVRAKEGELQQLTGSSAVEHRINHEEALKAAREATTLKELMAVARAASYKPGWAFYQWQRKQPRKDAPPMMKL